MRLRRVLTGVAALVTATAVATGVAVAAGGPTNVGSFSWTQVRQTTPDPKTWAPRAGLQAVELRDRLLVMGGRGPFSETETVLYGDVWKSVDEGGTWSRTAASAWPERAYFGAITHLGRIFVIGGQNFESKPNPSFPEGCQFLPPGVPCPPTVPDSTFFNDVWSSWDGETWRAVTTDAPWAGRAGLSAVVHRGAIYVLGGSQGDDVATGGQGRELFNDVWRSYDGRHWTRMTESAEWSKRAGAAVVSKDGYLYVLGGERGFSCGFDPASPCQPATATLYFNDVWRSRDGVSWTLVTPSAGWSPRPGHQCVVVYDQIVCFGGYGEVPGAPPVPANPIDVWTSRDGGTWRALGSPAAPPWNATSPAGGRYDFDALVVRSGHFGLRLSIMTFGGDRERFGLPADVNARLVENDVWRLGR
ncbi:MAG: hypothetical protein ACKVUT_01940 [Gaiella sp.]